MLLEGRAGLSTALEREARLIRQPKVLPSRARARAAVFTPHACGQTGSPLDSPLNLLIENGGKEGVFRKSRLSSFAPRVAPVFIPVFLGCVSSSGTEASVWQRSEKQLPARRHHRSSVSRQLEEPAGGFHSARGKRISSFSSCVVATCSLVGTWGGAHVSRSTSVGGGQWVELRVSPP